MFRDDRCLADDRSPQFCRGESRRSKKRLRATSVSERRSSTPQAVGEESAALSLVAQQFNSITPENLLKWQEVHPQPDEFNFDPVDRFVAFGEKNGMFIVGHNLVWHSQTPGWVFEGDSARPLDRETLLKRMQSHIQAVAGRYKGRISAWDVVNEAIDDDGSLRKSKWQKIIGDDYIEKAFNSLTRRIPKPSSTTTTTTSGSRKRFAASRSWFGSSKARTFGSTESACKVIGGSSIPAQKKSMPCLPSMAIWESSS